MISKDPAFISLPSPHQPSIQPQHPFSSAPNMYPSQMSGPQSPPMHHPQSPPMHHPQSPPMHHPSQAEVLHHYPPPPGEAPQSPPQASNQYPQFSYDIKLQFPPGGQPQNGGHPPPQHQYPPPPGSQGLPLPSMSQALPPLQQGPYPPPPQQEMPPDTTGQIAPPGSKPRVTATLWEDEGTLCFQVDVKGTCVARREDNHMINGTKLLNVAGMTRGRRDGILKAEKQKHVVKIGPMHLKGVWIPFEKALEFANKERITEQLYPLFVHNIGALLYHPSNAGVGALHRASLGGGGGYRDPIGAPQGGGMAPGPIGNGNQNGGMGMGGQDERWQRRDSVQSQHHMQQQSQHDFANDQRLASEQLHHQQQQQQQQQQQGGYQGYPIQGQ